MIMSCLLFDGCGVDLIWLTPFQCRHTRRVEEEFPTVIRLSSVLAAEPEPQPREQWLGKCQDVCREGENTGRGKQISLRDDATDDDDDDDDDGAGADAGAGGGGGGDDDDDGDGAGGGGCGCGLDGCSGGGCGLDGV